MGKLPGLVICFFFAVGFFALSLYTHNIIEFQQDLGRHLLVGRIISQTGNVPATNLLSYTNPNFQFVNSHWLSEVVFYGVSKISISALVIFKAFVVTLAVLLTVLTALKSTRNLLAVVASFSLLSPILLERTEIRPEIFSYFFISIFIFILYRNHTRMFWLLPLLQILWVNTHIYFILGPILILFSLLQKKTSKYVLVLILVCGATLLNPNFLAGAIYPLRVFDNYGYTIVENQNIFFLESLGVFNPNILYFKIAFLAFVTSFFLRSYSKPYSQHLFLILNSLFIILPIIHIRSFPLLFFLLLPVLAQNLSQPNKFVSTIASRYKFVYQVFLISLIGLIFFRSFRLISNDYYQATDSGKRFGLEVQEKGNGAADFMLKNNLSGPVLNNFDIGGYLAYRFYPKHKLFIDNRPEAYPAKFIQGEYIPMQESRENFDTVSKIYEFKTIIFAHTDGTPWGQNFLQMVSHHSEWSLVYLDDYAVIYTKKSAALNVPLITPNLPNPPNPSYLAYLSLGRFFSLTDQNVLAQQSFERAYQLNPDSALTNQALGIIYAGSPLAQKYLRVHQEKSSLILF